MQHGKSWKVKGPKPASLTAECTTCTRTTLMAKIVLIHHSPLLSCLLVPSKHQSYLSSAGKVKFSVSDYVRKWGSCKSCTRWVRYDNVVYMMWLCVERAFERCVEGPHWLRIEEVVAIWNSRGFSPLLPKLLLLLLLFTVQTAAETVSSWKSVVRLVFSVLMLIT